MAISNTDGNYLKITRVDSYRNIIFFDKYKDLAIRNAPTEFDRAVQGTIHVGSLPEIMASFSTTGNLQNDITASGYIALKNEPPYNGASGEVWSDC